MSGVIPPVPVAFGVWLAVRLNTIPWQSHIKLIDLDPVLQRFRFLLAGCLQLLHLFSDRVLEGAKLAGFQPSKCLVPAVQRKTPPLMTAFNALPFHRVQTGITPDWRNDRPQPRHSVKQRKNCARRTGECRARFRLVGGVQRHAFGGMFSRHLLAAAIELPPPRTLPGCKFSRKIGHSAIDALVDAFPGDAFTVGNRRLCIIDASHPVRDRSELGLELPRLNTIDLPGEAMHLAKTVDDYEIAPVERGRTPFPAAPPEMPPHYLNRGRPP